MKTSVTISGIVIINGAVIISKGCRRAFFCLQDFE